MSRLALLRRRASRPPLARLVSLALNAVLVGSSLSTRVAVHPAMRRLPGPQHLQAEQEMTRRFLRLMPLLMIAAAASAGPSLGSIPDRSSPAFRLAAAGHACSVAMVLTTLIGNMPVNRATLAATSDDLERWLRLRDRWDRFHDARVALDLAATGLLLASLSADEGRARG